MPPSPYILTRWIDFFFVGGFSLATFVGCYFWFGDASHPMAASLSAILVWLVNWPHFAATSYRLYCSKENRSQYPLTAYFVPFVVIIASILALCFPNALAPFFVKLVLIWSPYHFSGQTVGVTLLYARRSNFSLDSLSRRALSLFVFGTFAYTILRSEESTSSVAYFGVSYPGMGIPSWVSAVGFWITHLSGIVFVVSSLFRARKSGQWVPLLVWVPALTQYTWFVMGASVPVFYTFVPLFHSIQYLFIAWILQLREKQGRLGVRPSVRFALTETTYWFAVNVGIGAALFYALPKGVASFGVSAGLAEAVLVAAVQLHHFIVDGVIWKLRHTQVVSPLLACWRDVTSPPPDEMESRAAA